MKTDEELVKLYRQGDKDAFSELCDRFHRMIVSLSRKADFIGKKTEDLIQEGFLGLYYAVNHYDADKEGASSFGTFAYMCINSSVKKAASKGDNIGVSLDDIKEKVDEEASVSVDKIAEEEAVREIIRKLEKVLSDFERQVLGLYLEGYNYAEIAKELNVLPKKADNAIFRIKRKTRELLS